MSDTTKTPVRDLAERIDCAVGDASPGVAMAALAFVTGCYLHTLSGGDHEAGIELFVKQIRQTMAEIARDELAPVEGSKDRVLQ
jgi:hypothetical protein